MVAEPPRGGGPLVGPPAGAPPDILEAWARIQHAVPCPHPKRPSRYYYLAGEKLQNLCMQCKQVFDLVFEGLMGGTMSDEQAREWILRQGWDHDDAARYLADLRALQEEQRGQ